MVTRSIASIKREQKRNSPETIQFKNKVIALLKDAKPEIEYSIKKDLAIMTSMPFYKDRPEIVKFKCEPTELICEYAKLFITCEDKEFVVELIRKLSINQGQTIRKAAPKIGVKKDIWEHVIPAKVIADEIIKMVLSKDISSLKDLLKIYQKAGQRGLTRDENRLLDRYRSSMPEGWDWRVENADILARYKAVGLLYF
ncbi:MAG: hypothetical protein ACK41Z_04220 [Sediminibacterium sp.]